MMIRKIIRGIAKYSNLPLAIIISPFFIILGYGGSFIGRFAQTSIIIAYIPFYVGEWTRYIYYRSLLRKLGNKTIFRFGSYVQYRETEIGHHCRIGPFNAIGLVSMGDDVLCGGYVNFTSGLKQHSFADPKIKINKSLGERTRIIIGSDIWIGNNALICADIGNRSVIGAGTVVIKNLEGGNVYVGNPARQISKIKT